MEFLELAKTRHSTRKYTEKPVEKEKLDKILQAACLAPSAHNNQSYKILVVQSPEGLGRITKAGNLYGAPLAMIVCEDKNTAWTNPFNDRQLISHDSVIATDYMILEAADLGLNSVWICKFDPAIIKVEFDLPDNLEPINIVAVGYASDTKIPTKIRKELSDLVAYEHM